MSEAPMFVDIKESLLDSKPGKVVWFLDFKLGDRTCVYPVTFMGFIGGQPAPNKIVITNPWFDGYSEKVQNHDCHGFRGAYLLREVSVYDVFASAKAAFFQLIDGLQRMGFDAEAIEKFLEIEFCGHHPSHGVLWQADAAQAASIKLHEFLEEDPWCNTYDRMRNITWP